MKKIVCLALCLVFLFLFVGCEEGSFLELEIIAEDVTDVAVGEYTLRYSIPDISVYEDKYSATVTVNVFDQDNKEVDVKNNRILEIKADYTYTVTVLVQGIEKGEPVRESKQFTVTAIKTPRKVTFSYHGVKHKEIEVPYGGKINLSDYPVPDVYTMSGSGVTQVITSKKWMLEVDGRRTDLTQGHLDNITEDMTIVAEYVYSTHYDDITITFDNGEGEPTDSIVQIAGQRIEMPSLPRREGYIFDGWYEDPEYDQIFSWVNTQTIVDSMTLYAKWLLNDTQEYEQYFRYFGKNVVEDTYYTDTNGYPYYTAFLNRQTSYPDVICVPVGHNNIPVRGFENTKKDPNDIYSGYSAGAFEDSTVTEVTIPTTFRYPGVSSFKNCLSLTKITFLGTEMITFGSRAFYGCSALESIVLPEGLTTAGEMTFYNCTSLTSVTLPSTLTEIGDDMFSGCSSLTSIVIPDKVRSINANAFASCKKLSTVTIGRNSSLVFVATGTSPSFYGCDDLSSITLPYCFKGSTSIKNAFPSHTYLFYHEEPEKEEGTEN